MRQTVAEISFVNMAHNFNFIRAASPNSEIIAIVKANAYGHGIVEISRELSRLGVKFFGVAFSDEGVTLREAGIEGTIIILVPETNSNTKKCVDYNLTPVVYSLDFMHNLNKYALQSGKTVNAHLFIDTGMNREGIAPETSLEFMRQAAQYQAVNINGICTHFATSTSDIGFATKQLDLFNETIETLEKAEFYYELKHAANSGAIVKLPESKFNAIRPGLALYGLPPSFEQDIDYDVLPILTLKTSVISVREINPGDTVGYSFAYVSDKKTRIATLPLGYGDGFLRILTNKAQCLIKGKRYNLVGTICMDVCMVDIMSDDINVGDEVVIIGSQYDESISAYELAESAETIPYEILAAISLRVPRVYHSDK